jgi:tetratricopeptide (TPR) repeat protein
VDVTVFERAAADESPDSLERAAALYRGDFLAGLSVNEPAFEEWLVSERERLREVALDAMARLLAHQRATGAPEAAVQTALRLLALDPLQEPVHRTLMRLYARLGRRGAALRQYQICVGVLDRELGTVPETETRELYQQLLQQTFDVASGVETQQTASHPSHRAPLIGRGAEMAILHEALTSAWAGRGQLVVVRGEAGIGKSRLIVELSADAIARDGRALLGRSYEAERILAFGAWVDALRAARLSHERALLAALDPVWRDELARLLPELGVSASSTLTDYRQLFEAIAQVIHRLAASRPLLLILEDIHWADAMSMRLLAYLGRRISTWPVLVVLTARDEDLVDAPSVRRTLEDLARDGLIELRLDRLSRADTVALVGTVARAGADDSASASRAEAIWAASEGNPFMAVEMLRSIDESPASAPLAHALLPERVREVIARRLDRLSAPAAQVVAVAAVIGRDFDFALLRHAAESTEAATAEALEELVRRRLLHGVGETFDLTHDRIRETAYGRLIEPRRKILHRRVADALEMLRADNLDAHALALGLHFLEAEAWDTAVAYLRRAGVAAAARSANREAVACFEQALRALARLPQTRDAQEQTIDLHFEIRNSLFPFGDDEQIHDHLREAEALAERLNDTRRLGWAWTYMSHYYWRRGDHRRGLEIGRRALGIAADLGDARLEALTNFRLGQLHISTGEYRHAVPVLRRSMAFLSGDLVREQFGLAGLPAVFARAFLAWALAELGEVGESMEIGHEALTIATTLNQPYSQDIAEFAVGLGYLRKGDLGRALTMFEPERPVGEGVEVSNLTAHRFSVLGYAYVLRGRIADAIVVLEQALPATTSRFRGINLLTMMWLGEAYLSHGRAVDAARLGREALDTARHSGERGNEAYALKLLGDVEAAARRPDVGASERCYVEALALAEELGMRPLVGYCHLGLGRLYRRIGKDPQADEHLTAAARRFRELDMPFWLEKTGAPSSRRTPPSGD